MIKIFVFKNIQLTSGKVHINPYWLLALIALFSLIATMFNLSYRSEVLAQALPDLRVIHVSGIVTVKGDPVPDGTRIVAVIGTYTSRPIEIGAGDGVRKGIGEFKNLEIQPHPNVSKDFIGETITFELVDGTKADQTTVFECLEENPGGRPCDNDFFSEARTINLTFPRIVTPTPTPTPIPLQPEFYQGFARSESFPNGLPTGLEITATIGDREFGPALISSGRYLLTVQALDSSYLGDIIRFFVRGTPAYQTATYSGSIREAITLDLVFPSLPTPTPLPPTPTPTPVPQPPTPTPTPTPVPVPPTPTPTPTPTSGFGSCNSTIGTDFLFADLALILLIPLGLIAVRFYKKRK